LFKPTEPTQTCRSRKVYRITWEFLEIKIVRKTFARQRIVICPGTPGKHDGCGGAVATVLIKVNFNNETLPFCPEPKYLGVTLYRTLTRVHQEPSNFFKQLLPSVKVLHFCKK